VTQARVSKFGKRIRQLRKDQEWSQEAFADYSGLDRSYIGQVERGEKNITLKNLFKIADALEVEPYVLFVSNGQKIS